jgi:hypothetical protein
MELEMNYQPPTGAEIDAINGILADYSAIRRAARLGSAAAPTFAEIYKLFYEDKFNSTREYSTQYKQSIKSAFRNCAPLHDRPIAEITLDDLQGIIDSCNLKHSSIELIKILYTGIYGYADARSLVPKNLAPYVKNPLVDDDEHGVPFSIQDIKTLWDHSDDPTVEMISRPCPLFVPLVENGRIHRGDVVIETVAREYLQPMKDAGVDTLILGCTHYPLLTDIIADIMGPEVELVSAGEESAFELKRVLKIRGLRADENRTGGAEFYVSDRPDDFEATASVFLGENLHHAARRIDIDQY